MYTVFNTIPDAFFVKIGLVHLLKVYKKFFYLFLNLEMSIKHQYCININVASTLYFNHLLT